MEYTCLEHKALDEKYYVFTHESGLKIYICPKPGFTKKCAYFAANYGSVDVFYEKDGKKYEIPDGLAHFLEHKLFESEEGDAFSKYAKTGASANAFTSFGCTAYNFSCTDKLEENLKILIDLMRTPYFTEQNVAKEQGIIGQEINMYLDEPGWRVYQNMLEAMYKDCTVRRDIAGSVESISGITPELLYDCYNMYYAPENMVLVIAGDVDVFETAAVVENLLSGLKTGKAPNKYYPEEQKEVVKEYTEQKLAVGFPIYMLGFKGAHKAEGFDLLRQEIIGKTAMDILFGKSSAFYLTAYDDGLINENFEFDYECCPQYCHAIISGEGDQYEAVKAKINETIKNALDKGVDASEFERKIKLCRSGYIRRFNNVETVVHNLMESAFMDYNLYDYLEACDSVTLQDVEKFIREELAEDRSVLSVILPK
ncbi:MAG: insulinase family protein [Clostridia bacterium]|nr:insulinase family protein [Clostridia bacterium]